MRRRHLGPFALIALGALLLAAAAGWAAYGALLANPGEAPVPEAVGGFRQSQKAVGPEALAEVSRLHGKAFPLTSGAVAAYGSGEATLWVAGTVASPVASQMVRAMTDKIAEGRSPFTVEARREVRGRAVYELVGLGQRHFYFQSGNLVVWLAADDLIAERAIGEALEFYR